MNRPCRPEGTAVWAWAAGHSGASEALVGSPRGRVRAVHMAEHHLPTGTRTYSNGCHTGLLQNCTIKLCFLKINEVLVLGIK